MKKFFLILVCLCMSHAISAQKEYVVVELWEDSYKETHVGIEGDEPEGFVDPGNPKSLTPTLNELARLGYELEKVLGYEKNSRAREVYIFSKSNNSSSTKIIKLTDDDKNDDVVEVARYNLQGIPVKESDKGLQIIVYSNYTTKTVLIQ